MNVTGSIVDERILSHFKEQNSLLPRGRCHDEYIHDVEALQTLLCLEVHPAKSGRLERPGNKNVNRNKSVLEFAGLSLGPVNIGTGF